MVTVSTIFEVGSEFNSLYLIVSFVFNKQSGYVEYLCVRTCAVINTSRVGSRGSMVGH